MNKTLSWISLAFFLVMPYSVIAEAIEFKPFTATSMQRIKVDNAKEPFVIVLWGLDCPSCHEELSLLTEWLNQHPETRLVIISTDMIEEQQDVLERLSHYDVSKAEHWIYADSNKARLRHSIDPKWFGEIPRSYLFDSQHKAYAQSGLLSKSTLEKWLALVTDSAVIN